MSVLKKKHYCKPCVKKALVQNVCKKALLQNVCKKKALLQKVCKQKKHYCKKCVKKKALLHKIDFFPKMEVDRPTSARGGQKHLTDQKKRFFGKKYPKTLFWDFFFFGPKKALVESFRAGFWIFRPNRRPEGVENPKNRSERTLQVLFSVQKKKKPKKVVLDIFSRKNGLFGR